MKAVGIISEYNPFHEGHAYHIEQAKKLSGADFAVVIMNGDFVQRGEPAIIDKYTRTTQALRGGADLVFELPVRFGISSAGDFAYGGILALEKLGFVDSVCFGSECGDLTLLEKVADILHDEPSDFKFFLSLVASTSAIAYCVPALFFTGIPSRSPSPSRSPRT